MSESSSVAAWRAKCCDQEGDSTKAYGAALSLMGELESRSPLLNFDADDLDKQWAGKMFGVLHCIDSAGCDVYLRGFSGILGGQWLIAGWAPPCFDVEAWRDEEARTDPRIKGLESRLRHVDPQCEDAQSLRHQRKVISQKSMKVLQKLYRFRNDRGVQAGLYELYQREYNIPSGSGDCCAPKLLTWAADRQLEPYALYEFYWGTTNRSGTREQGRFYPSCKLKCAALMPFFGGTTGFRKP